MKNVTLILLLLLSVGCTTDLTRELGISKLAESCFKLKIKALIYESSCPSVSGRYILAPLNEKYKSCLKSKPIGQLDVGTQLEVSRVLSEGIGSSGHCWRLEIKVKGGKNSEMLIDVPACFEYHPDSWINSIPPPLKLGEKLEFRADYIELCNY